jgi:hypothetical protein
VALTVTDRQAAATRSNLSVLQVTTTAMPPASDGACGLIEALENANDDAATHADCLAGSGADTVVLQPGATYVITDAFDMSWSGLPEILSTVTISGNGATIKRDPTASAFRFFFVPVTGTLTLQELTLWGGDLATDNYGGAVCVFGGELTLDRVSLIANRAIDGGGLYNEDGKVTITGSQILSNTAMDTGGGIYNEAYMNFAGMEIEGSEIVSNTAHGTGGGGITNVSHTNVTATLLLNESFVGYNVANSTTAQEGIGGGIWNTLYYGSSSNSVAHIMVYDSAISHNRAANGAGIANVFLIPEESQLLLLEVEGSTISHNATYALSGNQQGNGGGIFNLNGTATVLNSTLSHNEANGIPTTQADVAGMGGGAVNAGSTKASTLSFLNATVAHNYARVAGGGLGTGLLDAAAMGTVTRLKNTIVATNTAEMLPGNCTSQPGTVPNMFFSVGHNLEDADTCNLTQSSDLVDVDPLLGPLSDNGGETLTHPLLPNSPAIDAGACIFVTDQRDRPRPAGEGCDIGAYERQLMNYLPIVLK